MSRIHRKSPVPRKRSPAAFGSARARVWEASKVANIDDFEADPRQQAHLAVQHPAEYPD
jgi:hypothetical protein